MKPHAASAVIGVLMMLSVHVNAKEKPFLLEEATIDDVQAAYKSGATTAEFVVRAYQERIQA